jgi:hypothetical protein
MDSCPPQVLIDASVKVRSLFIYGTVVVTPASAPVTVDAAFVRRPPRRAGAGAGRGRRAPLKAGRPARAADPRPCCPGTKAAIAGFLSR